MTNDQRKEMYERTMSMLKPALERIVSDPDFRQQLEFKPLAALTEVGALDMQRISGMAWRRGDEIFVNAPRPFVSDLDDLPIPLHHLLPLDKYRIPMVKGPYTFIVTSRGCPAG